MDRMLAYFENKRKMYPDIDDVCKKIVWERRTPGEGISIEELKDEYMMHVDAEFPIARCITEFLLTIPNVAVYSDEKGTRYFYTVE